MFVCCLLSFAGYVYEIKHENAAINPHQLTAQGHTHTHTHTYIHKHTKKRISIVV